MKLKRLINNLGILKSNYKKDGKYENSHFVKDNDFNKYCASLIINSISENENLFTKRKNIKLIDIGSGTCELIHEIVSQISHLPDFPVTLDYYCIEPDFRKLEQRKNSINRIKYLNTDYKEIKQLVQNDPVILLQRAVTHYFCNSNPDSENNEFTKEQLSLFKFYLDKIAPNSLFIEIISTASDSIGLKRFEYLLSKIANKKMHYLTVEGLSNLVDRANGFNDNKRFALLQRIDIPSQFGKRNFKDLYNRYCKPDEKINNFKTKLTRYYYNACKIFPGKTDTFIELNKNDFDINIKYNFNLYRVEKKVHNTI